MGDLVVIERVVTDDGLALERGQEQQPERDGQAVGLHELHGSVVCQPDHGEEGDPGDDDDEIGDEHHPHVADARPIRGRTGGVGELPTNGAARPLQRASRLGPRLTR